MPYREVRVVDYQEVLRRWLAGDGVRSIARGTGLDRKTVRRLVRVTQELGLKPGDPWSDDQTVSMFTSSVRRPGPPAQHGESEKTLLQRREQIQQWIEKDGLILTKVHELLTREGVVVSYAALHRFAHKWCDFGKRTSVTVRKLEGRPGEFAEVDFGRLGSIEDLGSRRPRLVHAYTMVAGYSRLSCVVPVFRQNLEAVIRCFEEAFRFFQGSPNRIVIDNVKACLDLAALTPLEGKRFVIPCWARCQVHPDNHIRFLYALYSVPTQYVGKEVDGRGDGALVRIYHQAQLIKTHAQKPRAGHSTDYDDYSLRYFEPLIEEVQKRLFPADYRQYVRMVVKKLAGLRSQPPAKCTGDPRHQDMPGAPRRQTGYGAVIGADITRAARGCEGKETR